MTGKIAESQVDERALTDLQIIDELLLIMKGPSRSWADVEQDYDITRLAMRRLRQAWADGDVRSLTMGLAQYLEATQEVERSGTRPLKPATALEKAEAATVIAEMRSRLAPYTWIGIGEPIFNGNVWIMVTLAMGLGWSAKHEISVFDLLKPRVFFGHRLADMLTQLAERALADYMKPVLDAAAGDPSPGTPIAAEVVKEIAARLSPYPWIEIESELPTRAILSLTLAIEPGHTGDRIILANDLLHPDMLVTALPLMLEKLAKRVIYTGIMEPVLAAAKGPQSDG